MTPSEDCDRSAHWRPSCCGRARSDGRPRRRAVRRRRGAGSARPDGAGAAAGALRRRSVRRRRIAGPTTRRWRSSRWSAPARPTGTSTTWPTSKRSGSNPTTPSTPRWCSTHTRTAHLWRWPIPEAVTTLAELARRGVPMGVVSNASGQIADVLCGRGCARSETGIGTLMRCVIDSHMVGVAKPDPAIFEHALVAFRRVRPRPDRLRRRLGEDGRVRCPAAGLHPLLLDPHDDHAGADVDRIKSLEDLFSISI